MTSMPRSTRLAGALAALGSVLLLGACEFDLSGLERDGEIRIEMVADGRAVTAPPSGATSIEEGVVEIDFRAFAVLEDGTVFPLSSGTQRATVDIGRGFLPIAARGLPPARVVEILVEIDRASINVVRGRVLGDPAVGIYAVDIQPATPVTIRHTDAFEVAPATQHILRMDLNAHEWIEFHVGRVVPVAAFAQAVVTSFE